MEEKKLYNVVLISGSFRDLFLEDIKDKYELKYISENVPSVLRIYLTESERKELFNNVYVVGINEDKELISTSVNLTNKIFTPDRSSIDASKPGTDYANPIHKYHTNGTGITQTLGKPTINGIQHDTYKQITGNYYSEVAGENVDVVIWELYNTSTPRSRYTEYLTHPEFKMPGTNTSRLVPMNWSIYNSAITSDQNTKQLQDQTYMFAAHWTGVASCAAGFVGGLAKKSSIRSIWASDGYLEAIDAIINWHNSKPINPVTGQRNATVVNASISRVDAVQWIKVSQIASFRYRGTTINRPSSGEWNLNTFASRNVIPRKLEIPANSGQYEWVIPMILQGILAGPDNGLDLVNAFKKLANNNIVMAVAAGNDSKILSKYQSLDWDNSITTDSDHSIYTPRNAPYTFNTPATFYVHRTYDFPISPDVITVAAMQPSEVKPYLDDYSTRGPVIDICANGVGSWSGQMYSTMGDGYSYGHFQGTSAAAPNVTGILACMAEYYFKANGAYPNYATLKSLLITNGVNHLQSYPSANWSSNPDPNTEFDLSNILTGSGYNVLISIDSMSLGSLAELAGTTPKKAFLPDYMRTYVAPPPASTSLCTNGQGKKWSVEVRWAVYRSDGVKIRDFQTKIFDLIGSYKNNQGFNQSDSDWDTWNFDESIDLDPAYSYSLGLELKNQPYEQCECNGTSFEINCSRTTDYNAVGFRVESRGYFSRTRAVYPYDTRPTDRETYRV